MSILGKDLRARGYYEEKNSDMKEYRYSHLWLSSRAETCDAEDWVQILTHAEFMPFSYINRTNRLYLKA